MGIGDAPQPSPRGRGNTGVWPERSFETARRIAMMSAHDLMTHRRDPRPQIVEAVGMDQPLASGEVHFLWWFIQGSIMDIDVCRNLRRAWGLCARHTCAWLVVDAAFRHGFLHGPAVVYADL